MPGLSNVFKSVIFLDQISQENIKLQSSDSWSATGNRGGRWNVSVDKKNCFHILEEKWGVLAKMRNYFWHLTSLLQPSLYIIWRWRRNDNYNISFYFQSKFFIWKQDWKFSSSLNKITWYLSKSELPTIILMYDKNKAGSPQVENRCVFNEFFLFRNPSFDSVGPSKLCDPVTTSYWWTVGLAGVALLN